MSIKEHLISFENSLPEFANITFETSGECGGDAGHGGYAKLIIELPFCSKVTVCGVRSPIEDNNFSNKYISIEVNGDMELEGLAIALAEIGRKIIFNKGDIQESARKLVECGHDDLIHLSKLKFNDHENIQSITYRAFELAESAIKAAIAQAIEEQFGS